MSGARKRRLRWLAVVVILIAVAYFGFASGVSIAYLTLLILAFVAIAWFIWRVFLRVYWRANRIAHIRERRLLMEASQR